MLFIDYIKRRNLRFKILFLFALILIFPLTILTISTLNRISVAADQDFTRSIDYASKLFRNTVQDHLDSFKIRVKTMADFDFYALADKGFPPDSTIPVMQYELAHSGLDYIAIIANHKEILLAEGTPPTESLEKIISEMCHSPLNVNIYIVRDKPWFVAAAMITRHKSSVTKHVIFAKRIPRDFADRLKGLTGAEYSITYAGKILLTSRMDIYGKRITGYITENPDLIKGYTNILGKQFFFVREELLKRKISNNIKLEIALPDSEYNILELTMRRDFMFFGLLGLILALVTGTILSWHIAKPINALAVATTLLTDTKELDLEQQLELPKITREDEIGILSRNFKEMVSRINNERDLKEQHMKELNTLFEISNAVNFFSDSEELLKFILTHAIEILEAERGSIMLLDDETDELIVKVASGGHYKVFSSNAIKLGHGICGTVALKGTGIICNEGFKDSRFKNFGSLMPVKDIQTLICSPLKFKDGIIGVINIVNKRNKEFFVENDLSLLNVIASQAAVTIENNKLYELSITDGMSKLFVHRYFQAKLSEELLRARRYGLVLSLIMIDIDFFKKFNDEYGHQVGDLVIQKVALTIKDMVRTGIDVPCRYGGEEMTVIFPETRAEEAFHTAERIRERIANIVMPHNDEVLRITVSIGVASYPTHCHDRETLISVADKALYSSKNAGRNCSTLASASTTTVL